MDILKRATWIFCIAAVLAAALTYTRTSGVELRDDIGKIVVDRLIALGVIAAIIERALEVLIEPWRAPGKNQLILTQRLQELPGYRNETRLIGLVAGTAFGMLVAALGFRVIEPMAAPGSWEAAGSAIWLLRTVDVLLVGLLIGGGSDALHKLVMMILDFVDGTRRKTNAAAR